jgi:hypothetical protein
MHPGREQRVLDKPVHSLDLVGIGHVRKAQISVDDLRSQAAGKTAGVEARDRSDARLSVEQALPCSGSTDTER